MFKLGKIGLVAALCVTLLAACGGGSNESGGASGDGQEKVSTPELI
ncbi:hypothetical protein [Cohnella massiliensis]|nr:hypothetical protein [Cohnella massiliensis]